MDKYIEIHNILVRMAEELAEVVKDKAYQHLSPEELVELALDLTLNKSDMSFSNEDKVYSPLSAEIIKESVHFYIDEKFQVPLYSDEPISIGDNDDEDFL